MTSRDFCYWLQGYFEIENPDEISNIKLEMIKNNYESYNDVSQNNNITPTIKSSKPKKPKSDNTMLYMAIMIFLILLVIAVVYKKK